jgi:hypothetical protein
MVSANFARLLQQLGSLYLSPGFCTLVCVMLFATPVALAAPVRIYESNSPFPVEEETKSSSPAGATEGHYRQRVRSVGATIQPVLRTSCEVSSGDARTRAPNGSSEHAFREGLGTPLRC